MNISLSHRTFFACLIAAALMTLSCSGGGSSSSPVVVTSGSGTVSGVVRYQDKEYNRNGFTGTNPYKSVRFATVQVVDTSSKAVLAAGTTGADGSYSLSYTGAGTYVYVRVLTQSEVGGSILVRVRNSSGATYAVGTGSFSSGGTVIYNMDIDLVSLSQVTGAYNILDVLTTGMQFAQGLAGAYPPQLSAFWEYNGTDGTYYCSSGCLPGSGMYIIGNSSGDTDGYDDDVILHEFGHFLADMYSRDDSMGGAHYIGDIKEDMRLSWSEGWGDFMPIAVRYWQTMNDPGRISSTDSAPSIYIDTNDGVPAPAINFYIVFGNPSDNNISGWLCATKSECFSYVSNELAIANLLWNSMTGTGNFGMPPIWSVIGSWHGLSTAALPLVNLESFWDTWIAQRSPAGNEYDAGFAAELSTLWNVYNAVNIQYKKDSYENDGASNIAKVINLGAANAQTHTLYSGRGLLDSDYYAFSTAAAGNYSAATSGLANGADTSITVYGEAAGNLTPITSNDNFNSILYSSCGGTMVKCTGGNYDYYIQDSYGNYINVYPTNDANTLSSRAAFNATGAANYFIEVKPSPNRPYSAGRYGTYTLMITEQ